MGSRCSFLFSFLCAVARAPEHRRPPRSSRLPPCPPPPAQSNTAVSNWMGNSTVVSSDEGNACGGATRVGVHVEGYRVAHYRPGAPRFCWKWTSFNWPRRPHAVYRHVDGPAVRRFLRDGSRLCGFLLRGARREAHGQSRQTSCPFDATETLIPGPPGEERTVQRRWTGSKL